MNVGNGSIADVRGHSRGINMAAVFAAALMPWPKHSFPMISGRLSQLPCHS
jgi:hypothetical protein